MPRQEASRRKSVLIVAIALGIVPFLISGAYAEWTIVLPPPGISSWYLNDVHFVLPNEGWAVGWEEETGSDGKGVLLHYRDEVWEFVPPPDISSGWELYGVHFTSSNEGWAVGVDYQNSAGVLLHYIEGNWTAVNVPCGISYWGIYSVHFTSSREGWAVGYDGDNNRGLLLHYIDGEWTVFDPGHSRTGWELYRVYFSSANEGWMVGPDRRYTTWGGVLLHYLNGTLTFVNPPDVSSYWGLGSVHFTSANEGWTVGWDGIDDRGVLFHYQNGLWADVMPPNISSDEGWELLGVYFTSPNEGWAAGYNRAIGHNQGVLLRYLNGLWANITPPDVSWNWNIYGLNFVSAYEGWAVGADFVNGTGVLLKYYTPPDITVTPMSIDFGDVLVGNTAEQIITVRNEGTGTLVLGAIRNPSVPFSRWGGTCNDGQILLPGSNCSIVITFSPFLKGLSAVTFDIPSNDPDQNTVTVDLRGTGICSVPGTPGNLSPSNGTVGVSVSPTLSWTATSNTDSYDLYFGTVSPPALVDNVTGTNYLLFGLTFGTTYHWKIVAKNSCGNSISGPVWSFTTRSLGITPVEGTIGTVVTITGSGFGSKKGKVTIGQATLKVIDWKTDTIQASLAKVMSPEIAYDVVVTPKEPKGVKPITELKAFTMKGPEITFVEPGSGTAGSPSPILIKGRFFGNKKGKMTLERAGLVKSCKVLTWTMDPEGIEDQIEFTVPKGLAAAEDYVLRVTNKVGWDTEAFIVNP